MAIQFGKFAYFSNSLINVKYSGIYLPYCVKRTFKMGSLREIIHSFDSREQAEFQYFVQRHKLKKGRKDLELFKLLKGPEQLDAATTIRKLGTKNANAYHAIRKRLFKHVSDYILVKSVDEDMSAGANVNSLYLISKYLFGRRLHKSAWKYLRKAEELGVNHDQYSYLNVIYNLQIEKHLLQDQDALESIIEKYEDNKTKMIQVEQINITKSMIREQVEMYKREGKGLDFKKIMDHALDSFTLIQLVMGSPKLLYELLDMMRKSVVATKDFISFEPFLVSSFNDLKNKEQAYYNVQILMMIVHTKYRNKKFQESITYIEQVRNELALCGKSFQNQVYPKIQQLLAANHVFLNENKQAISILKELLRGKVRLTVADVANINMNIGIYTFFTGDYKGTHKVWMSMEHSEKWYQKTMGIEWVMKKSLMEIILFYELEQMDVVESRIRSMERKYNELFKVAAYVNAKAFLGLIKEFIYAGQDLDLEKFKEKIESSIEWRPKEEEDLQAMIFYSWLRSKVNNADYYSSVLEVVIEP